MRNSAHPRPLYSVIGPATISVSASGESNGGNSSLPMRPTSATTKPIGCVAAIHQCRPAKLFTSPICHVFATIAGPSSASKNGAS